MKSAIPDLFAAIAFEDTDLDLMQSVLDETCASLTAEQREERAQVARAIFNVYSAGERDREKLSAVARKVAEQLSTLRTVRARLAS